MELTPPQTLENRPAVRRNGGGFTLIDMLFVVALIGAAGVDGDPGPDAGPRCGAGLVRARDAAHHQQRRAELRDHAAGSASTRPTFRRSACAPPGSTEAFPADEMTGGFTFDQERLHVQPRRHTRSPARRHHATGWAPDRRRPATRRSADPLDPSTGRFFGTNADGVDLLSTPHRFAAPCPSSGGPLAGTPIQ